MKQIRTETLLAIAALLGAAMIGAGNPASACIATPGDSGMRAALAEEDPPGTEAATAIYIATVLVSDDYRHIFVLQPIEALVGDLPEAAVRSPQRLWTSCGFLPHYYADWDYDLWTGETVIVRTEPLSTEIAQIAALDTPDGERLLELARARQEHLTGVPRSASE